MGWLDGVVGRLPVKVLNLGAGLAGVAFACLILATLDSTYRTHKPFKVAGYSFGYDGNEPSEAEKLKASVNAEFKKLSAGAVDDKGMQPSNESSKNGSGYSLDHVGSGRCPVGEVVVGISPLSSSEGTKLQYQCAKFPALEIP